MIEKIVLENFQSHKNTELDFHPGLNVIVGPSDNGKSSILKAFEWLRINRPKGNNFIQKGEKSSSVKLVINGTEIERKRDLKNTGSYAVKGELFTVIGNDVPYSVNNIINMSDINVQLQLDGHFLILDSPGKVAQYLNNITKLESLSNALKKIRKLKADCQNELKNDQEILNSEEEFINSNIKSLLKELKSCREKYIKLESNIFKIDSEFLKIKELLSSFEEIEQIKIDENLLDKFMELLTKGDKIISFDNAHEEEEIKIINLIGNLEKSLERGLYISNDIDKSITAVKTCKNKLTACPYCGSKLTLKTKEILIGN